MCVCVCVESRLGDGNFCVVIGNVSVIAVWVSVRVKGSDIL